jgi:hypothetical protein
MTLSCCGATEAIRRKAPVMCGGHEVSGSERLGERFVTAGFVRSASSDFGHERPSFTNAAAPAKLFALSLRT